MHAKENYVAVKDEVTTTPTTATTTKEEIKYEARSKKMRLHAWKVFSQKVFGPPNLRSFIPTGMECAECALCFFVTCLLVCLFACPHIL